MPSFSQQEAVGNHQLFTQNTHPGPLLHWHSIRIASRKIYVNHTKWLIEMYTSSYTSLIPCLFVLT